MAHEKYRTFGSNEEIIVKLRLFQHTKGKRHTYLDFKHPTKIILVCNLILQNGSSESCNVGIDPTQTSLNTINTDLLISTSLDVKNFRGIYYN